MVRASFSFVARTREDRTHGIFIRYASYRRIEWRRTDWIRRHRAGEGCEKKREKESVPISLADALRIEPGQQHLRDVIATPWSVGTKGHAEGSRNRRARWCQEREGERCEKRTGECQGQANLRIQLSRVSIDVRSGWILADKFISGHLHRADIRRLNENRTRS